MERASIYALTGMLACLVAGQAEAQTLRGSPQVMQQQNRIARQHDYTFLQNGAQVRRFVDAGYLVRLPGNADYALASVSYPYARPAVKVFVERLAAQYRAACGEKLVITSLTRPVSEQPRNASALSVHPAGMAVDLRVSGRAACRTWLERTLLSLERQGVLNAIRENRPPHYHVALFPSQYTQYVARLTGRAPSAVLASATSPPTSSRASGAAPSTAAGGGAPPAAGAVAADAGAGGAVAAGEDAAEAEAVLVAAVEAVAADSDGEHTAAELEKAPEPVERYRVNRGDTLWSIARRYGTTVDALRTLNNLSGSSILAGQVISVPAQRPAEVNP